MPTDTSETPANLLTLLYAGGHHETAQTALPTKIAAPEALESLEVTPLVERSVELFFVHLYPIYPLLSQGTVLGWLQNSHLPSKSEQTLIWSICASTLVLVDSWPSLGSEQRAVSSRQFIRRCQQLRASFDYMEDPTLEDILTSLFIANTLFELKCRKASWGFVREAITIASAAGLHDSQTYTHLSEEDQIRRQRAWALLYITERGAVIPDGFPVSILMPPYLPEHTLPGEGHTIAPGLSALHGLFSLLDFKFVKLWNHIQLSKEDPTHSIFSGSGDSDLLLLQMHLRELQIADKDLSDIQRADVLITQQ